MTDQQTTTGAEAPREDFASIVLTIDHLAETAHPGGHQIHKAVFSTQSLLGSVSGLLAYYGLQAVMSEESTMDLLIQARTGPGIPVIILHTLENTQVVADADTWAALIFLIGKGSVLKTVDSVVDMVGLQLKAQIETQGAASTLSLLMFSANDPDVVAHEEAAPQRRTRKTA